MQWLKGVTPPTHPTSTCPSSSNKSVVPLAYSSPPLLCLPVFFSSARVSLPRRRGKSRGRVSSRGEQHSTTWNEIVTVLHPAFMHFPHLLSQLCDHELSPVSYASTALHENESEECGSKKCPHGADMVGCRWWWDWWLCLVGALLLGRGRGYAYGVVGERGAQPQQDIPGKQWVSCCPGPRLATPWEG